MQIPVLQVTMCISALVFLVLSRCGPWQVFGPGCLRCWFLVWLASSTLGFANLQVRSPNWVDFGSGSNFESGVVLLRVCVCFTFSLGRCRLRCEPLQVCGVGCIRSLSAFSVFEFASLQVRSPPGVYFGAGSDLDLRSSFSVLASGYSFI